MVSPLTISIFIILSLLSLSSFSSAKTSPKPNAFIFALSKDSASNQYYTKIQIGSNATTFNAVIDLGGKFLWFNSPEYEAAAGSFRRILCGSELCKLVIDPGCVSCYETPGPRCSNNTCADMALNPYSGVQGYSGLGRDILRAYSTRGTQIRVRDFPFQFSDPVLLGGLPKPTEGMLGLGRSNLSLSAQLSATYQIREKFTLCIPSSGSFGNMIVGEAAYRSPFQKISGSNPTTPLVRNPASTVPVDTVQIGYLAIEYYIGVESIRVGEKVLSLNRTLLSINNETGEGGTSLRTVRPYTSLHKSIYEQLEKEFVKAAGARKIKRVAAVAPFGACFDSKTISGSKTGPDVPTVDLILQSKEVFWRFYGSNSMVRVSEGVMCLAFVEAQPPIFGPATAIVVGGYQLENYLLEFDVSSSKLGFSSSLSMHDTNCSNFGAEGV